jgi:hypothetical protein
MITIAGTGAEAWGKYSVAVIFTGFTSGAGFVSKIIFCTIAGSAAYALLENVAAIIPAQKMRNKFRKDCIGFAFRKEGGSAVPAAVRDPFVRVWFRALRTRAQLHDLPENYGPYTPIIYEVGRC